MSLTFCDVIPPRRCPPAPPEGGDSNSGGFSGGFLGNRVPAGGISLGSQAILAVHPVRRADLQCRHLSRVSSGLDSKSFFLQDVRFKNRCKFDEQ